MTSPLTTTEYARSARPPSRKAPRAHQQRAWAAERRNMTRLSASDILGFLVIAVVLSAALAVAADPEAITSLIARAFLSAVQ